LKKFIPALEAEEFLESGREGYSFLLSISAMLLYE